MKRSGNKSTEEIIFTVIENGLDFILESLNRLSNEATPRDLKYAILHLSAGVELILKARLQRKDWSLVFQDISKADLAAYNSGNFKSVYWQTCLERLETECGVTITKEDRDAIDALRGKRNRLEHFGTVDSAAALRSISAKVLNFLIEFVTAEFKEEHLSKQEDGLLGQVRRKLSDFEQFVDERMKKIQEKLNAVETEIVECPGCLQEALVIDNGTLCEFCGYSATGDTAVRDYVYSLYNLGWKYEADGGEIPIYECPSCGEASLLDVGSLTQNMDATKFICFSCASTWRWDSLSFCENCGNPFTKTEDGLVVCDDCFRLAVGRED